MNKQAIREQLKADIAAFLNKGGKVKKLPAKKIPENFKVTA